MLVSNLSHPGWHCSREKANLQIFSALISNLYQDFFNVLFETEFEHLISFIENYGLDVRKVNVTSFYMVKDSTSCANENFNSSLKFVRLGVDVNTTVNSQTGEVIRRML